MGRGWYNIAPEAKFNIRNIGSVDLLSVFFQIQQEDLVRTYPNTSYDAHNVLEDVVSLGYIFFYSNVSNVDLLKHSFQSMAMIH